MGLLAFLTVKKLNFTKPRWLTAAILKTVKLPYLFNRLTDFDEISHVDAHWPPTAGHPLKFRLLENQNGGGRHLANHKIAISPQRFARSLRNLVRRCKMGLLTSKTVKKLNFKNPTWQTAAI